MEIRCRHLFGADQESPALTRFIECLPLSFFTAKFEVL